MTEKKKQKYRMVAVSQKCGELLDEIYANNKTLKGYTVELALIEKYPEEAKRVGLKWDSEY